MDPSRPICAGLSDLIQTRERVSIELSGRSCVGSLSKSSECSCRCCLVACEAAAKRTGIPQHKRDHLDAVLRNSGVQFQDGDKANVEYFVQDPSDDSIIPTSTSISGNTGSEKSFKTILKWLNACLSSHHTVCSSSVKVNGAPRLPLRVLDLSSDLNQTVRLFQTSNEHANYACLSHCWGGFQPLRTTIEPNTLHSHQERIQWEDLPSVFQDAILITKKLELNYIWIDSLCIVQDDPMDWQVQSALMGEIYSNAAITIAASASSGPYQGLFRRADSMHLDSMFTNDDSAGLDKIRQRKPLTHRTENLPLLQRGWVFQERLLSPRYLHFGDNELIWECMETLTCECGRLTFNDRTRYGWAKPKNRFHPLTLQFLNQSQRGVSQAWQDAVEDYSRLRLSHSDDIFPALSGIAKTIQKIAGWEYIAGLWKESLIPDLTWQVADPGHARRVEHWRAPTFSWASITEKQDAGNTPNSKSLKYYISYIQMSIQAKGLDPASKTWRTEQYATLVDSKCVPKSQDITGQLDSAYIILAGTLIQATLRRNTEERLWQIAPLRKTPLESSVFHWDFDFDSAEHGPRDGDIVYCLKLLGLTRTPKHGCGEYLVHLVLRATNSVKSEPNEVGICEYERIGTLQDAYDYDAVQLEKLSEDGTVQRNAIVKII